MARGARGVAEAVPNVEFVWVVGFASLDADEGGGTTEGRSVCRAGPNKLFLGLSLSLSLGPEGGTAPVEVELANLESLGSLGATGGTCGFVFGMSGGGSRSVV